MGAAATQAGGSSVDVCLKLPRMKRCGGANPKAVEQEAPSGRPDLSTVTAPTDVDGGSGQRRHREGGASGRRARPLPPHKRLASRNTQIAHNSPSEQKTLPGHNHVSSDGPGYCLLGFILERADPPLLPQSPRRATHSHPSGDESPFSRQERIGRFPSSRALLAPVPAFYLRLPTVGRPGHPRKRGDYAAGTRRPVSRRLERGGLGRYAGRRWVAWRTLWSEQSHQQPARAPQRRPEHRLHCSRPELACSRPGGLIQLASEHFRQVGCRGAAWGGLRGVQRSSLLAASPPPPRAAPYRRQPSASTAHAPKLRLAVCRGLPLQWGENEITAVFGQFGQLTSLRLVRHSVTKHSLG